MRRPGAQLRPQTLRTSRILPGSDIEKEASKFMVAIATTERENPYNASDELKEAPFPRATNVPRPAGWTSTKGHSGV